MPWCQFDPSYNAHAKDLWKRTRKWDFDSSHEISDVDEDGVRRKIATFRHADDAGLVEKLVNAFRDGKLMIKEEDDAGVQVP